MGVVYAARDERLERTVALKTMSSLADDETARKRFWREARAAASVNHPNVCQIHEIGEDAGTLFIAMELLEGESLADRLQRGPLSVSEAVPIGLGMLAALSALHGRGLIHRDLKPSNVFLTPHGVKLLDFGLARPELERSLGSATGLTRTGVALGTPRYMAPEQATGEAVDARCDLFAAGAILFEMLAGRPAFGGRTVVDVLHATLHEQPPALTGSPAVAAVDRVIRRALAKRPAARPVSADAMAEELRDVRGVDGDDTRALAHALTRLVVLPFRVLRPDPETDFLAFSLPDAIATSLSGVGSLVVRSSATAARFAGEAPDLKVLAAEADVDRVVMGTLLRSGDELRATAQLVEAPGGTLLTSHTIQSSLGDLFRLQDDIARRVVEALSLPLAGGRDAADARRAAQPPRLRVLPAGERAGAHLCRTRTGARSVSARAGAGSTLRAGVGAPRSLPPCDRQVHRRARPTARRTRRRPSGAPSRSTRACRWRTSSTRTSRRTSARRSTALVRLLGEATRHGNDPELFAGLVHTCRYCGLYEESIAAHAEARRLDPNVSTSLEQTLLMTGDIDRLLAVERPPLTPGPTKGIRVIGLGLAGRRDEARRALLRMRQTSRIPAFRGVDRVPDGVARSPPRGHARPPLDVQRVEDSGRPRGDLPRGMDALRRRRARSRARLPSARGRQGLLRGPDALGQPAVRRAAERPRVPGAPGGRGSGPAARAGRVPRGRRRTPARPVTRRSEDAGPAA